MKISIIVPIYNLGEFYINRCVSSILAQTYKDFELILVDDGSTDNSGEVCDKMSLIDNRIHSFHKVNGGAGAARKYGVEQSIGEWIMFVDGDDTLPQDAIYQLIKTPNCCDYDIIVGSQNVNNQYIFSHHITNDVLDKYGYINALLLNNTQTGPWAKLYKRNIFNNVEWNVPKEIIQNEDRLMLITLSVNANKIYINTKAVCYNYLFRKDSVSKSQFQPYSTWLKLFDLIDKQLLRLPHPDKVKKAFFIYRIRLLYLNIINGNVFETKDPYIQSLINESSNYSLDSKEQKIIRLLKHRHLRKMKFISSKTYRYAKDFIKQTLGMNDC